MYVNKPIYLVLGIIAAASVVASGGFATPALASIGGGGGQEENTLDATNIQKKVMSTLTMTTISNTKITGTIAGIITTTRAGDTSSPFDFF